jgi:large subunit ribosomal protein L24e
MVVHRTCSFCAGEIEPGTGQLFVKRDGSLYSFCSSSCRKQQMGLGRVGHRLRWTRAHELKRLAEQRRQPGTTEAPAAPKAAGGKAKTAPAEAAKPAVPKKSAKPKTPEGDASSPAVESTAGPKKPRAKKPATPPAESS